MTDAISQTDYMQLFMQELTYQDPLKPVDNREFMAQMAQFSALQEARISNDYFMKLLGLTAATQGLMLLGKQVHIQGSESIGLVHKVTFPENQPPMLMISMNGALVQKKLSEISEVSQ
jgi:flagellar basal-body rod modification protein FlgD